MVCHRVLLAHKPGKCRSLQTEPLSPKSISITEGENSIFSMEGESTCSEGENSMFLLGIMDSSPLKQMAQEETTNEGHMHVKLQ